MKRRGWLIPILFFCISITGLIFYQKRQDSHSFAAATNLPPILWSESSVNINKILFSEAGHEIEALKILDDWELSRPVSTKADNLLIYNILLAFKQPALNEVIDTDPSNLQDYGIDSFSPTLTLYTKDNHIYELMRGKVADDSSYYVYSPMAHTIYTMPKSAFENIHTDFALWRDKNLLDLDKKDIDNITLTYQENIYTLSSFQTALDISFRTDALDEKVLNNLIDFLAASKVNNFITDSADTALLRAYGFNAPLLKVEIALKSGKILTAVIGHTVKEENLCYMVANDSKSIMTIPYFDLSGLQIEDVEQITTPDISSE